MARRVVVTGAGVVSPLGDSAAELHAALVAGRSALVATDLVPDGAAEPLTAGAITGFDPQRYLGDANFRPLDRTGQLAAAAAKLALADAGWSPEAVATTDIGLVLGTLYGSVRTIAEFDRRGIEAGPLYVKPFDFANSVINAAAGQTAIWHQLRGASSTVCCGAAAAVQAIALAADMVAEGRADAMLAGGAEELSFESLISFARAGLLTPAELPPRPFGDARRGFALGEGAGFLVLEAAEVAAARGARVHAEVVGHGSAFDSSQGRDETSLAAAVTRAVRLALAMAGRDSTAVSAVSAAASGGRGDGAEAQGLMAALGERAATVAVSAPKGLLGETLGAAGALQAAALLGAMAKGELPGVPGFARTNGFPLAAASAGTVRVDLDLALLDGIAMDGNCCALLLARGGAER